MVKRVCLAVFLLCAAGLLWLFGAEAVPQREPLYLTPESVPPFGYAGPLELSYTLPAWEGADRPMLVLGGLYGMEAALFLDGAPLQEIPAGTGRVYVTLPGDCAGKALTLRADKRAEDAMPFLFLTDGGALLERDRADTSLRAFPAAAFGLLFLLTLGLFLYGWAEGARPWPVLPLCAAALGQTVQFYLANAAASAVPAELYGLALHQSRALLFAAPPLYLLLGMGKRRRAVFFPFAVLPALFYWLTAGFQTVIPALSGIAARAAAPYCLTIAALLVLGALECRDGNPAFRFFLGGLGGCALAGLAACGVSIARTGALPPTLAMVLGAPLVWLEQMLFCWSTLLLALCFAESALAFIRQRARREAELQVLSARESLTREQLAAVRESAAALGRLRHDVKNHYLVLQKLSAAGERERLDAYLEELTAEASSIPPLACAPHPAIDAVLTVMLDRARRQGVEVERRVDVPEALPFPDTELCTVLMNLLQNALDANALAPEGARRWLRVDLHVRGAHLYIGVENARFAPVDYDEETGLCRTTKPDPAAHGYGLKAVQAVARKYRSELVLKFPEGSFSAATALQMPDE